MSQYAAHRDRSVTAAFCAQPMRSLSHCRTTSQASSMFVTVWRGLSFLPIAFEMPIRKTASGPEVTQARRISTPAAPRDGAAMRDTVHRVGNEIVTDMWRLAQPRTDHLNWCAVTDAS